MSSTGATQTFKMPSTGARYDSHLPFGLMRAAARWGLPKRTLRGINLCSFAAALSDLAAAGVAAGIASAASLLASLPSVSPPEAAAPSAEETAAFDSTRWGLQPGIATSAVMDAAATSAQAGKVKRFMD